MEFKTKFDKDDKVWLMKDDKPVEVMISYIEIHYCGTNQDCIMYNAQDVNNPKTWLDYQHLRDNQLFRTKKELLNSL